MVWLDLILEKHGSNFYVFTFGVDTLPPAGLAPSRPVRFRMCLLFCPRGGDQISRQ